MRSKEKEREERKGARAGMRNVILKLFSINVFNNAFYRITEGPSDNNNSNNIYYTHEETLMAVIIVCNCNMLRVSGINYFTRILNYIIYIYIYLCILFFHAEFVPHDTREMCVLA